MEGFNPVQTSAQRLARLSVAAILYQCRVGKAQKQVLEILSHVLSNMIESLFRQSCAFSCGTASRIQYEGFDGQELISLRPSPDFVHEANFIMDYAITTLPVFPNPYLCITGLSGTSWNPDYGLLELVEYAQLQTKFGEGQLDSLKRISEQNVEYPSATKPLSIFENNGFIHVNYKISPGPVRGVEQIMNGGVENVSRKRSLEPINEQEATVST